MHGITLGFGGDEALHAAASFLEAVQPFKFNAAVKKSQVHHALVEMLTKVRYHVYLGALHPLNITPLTHHTLGQILTKGRHCSTLKYVVRAAGCDNHGG
jgi:hypothetical protein